MHAHGRRSIQGISTRVPKGRAPSNRRRHAWCDGAVYVHACYDTHAWRSMASVVDLAQDNRTNLVAAQLSKELTRQVSTGTAGAERSEKQSTAILGSKTIPSWA